MKRNLQVERISRGLVTIDADDLGGVFGGTGDPDAGGNGITIPPPDDNELHGRWDGNYADGTGG
ncbi:MAG TPA: hypothetical protein VF789_29735 [Thermoanaerobaculia bacterium]